VKRIDVATLAKHGTFTDVHVKSDIATYGYLMRYILECIPCDVLHEHLLSSTMQFQTVGPTRRSTRRRRLAPAPTKDNDQVVAKDAPTSPPQKRRRSTRTRKRTKRVPVVVDTDLDGSTGASFESGFVQYDESSIASTHSGKQASHSTVLTPKSRKIAELESQLLNKNRVGTPKSTRLQVAETQLAALKALIETPKTKRLREAEAELAMLKAAVETPKTKALRQAKQEISNLRKKLLKQQQEQKHQVEAIALPNILNQSQRFMLSQQQVQPTMATMPAQNRRLQMQMMIMATTPGFAQGYLLGQNQFHT
jgi:hypothetical protein